MGRARRSWRRSASATFTVEAVHERERVTDHDVAAFVDVLGASAGEAGRWIHFGLTSSDVLDTALALQLKAVGEIDRCPARARWSRPWRRERASTWRRCRVGRTHGVHAEPTTFGVKLAGFAFEAHRNAGAPGARICAGRVGVISGAVGTYAATSPEYEARVLGGLGSRARTSPRRSSPRDRHAELLGAIALAGTGLERFATEVRHLQRTEVREVQEPFRRPEGLLGDAAQAQPDQVRADRGLARVLRGNAEARSGRRALARA